MSDVDGHLCFSDHCATVLASWKNVLMLDEISNFYEKYYTGIGTILIPTVTLIFAALAYYWSKSSAKAAQAAQLTNLRMSVQTSFQEAQGSLSNLQILCRQSESAVRSEWASRAPQLVASRSSLFGDDNVAVTKMRGIEREGAALLEKANEKLADLEQLSPKQLEVRYAEIKSITAQIDVLPMRLVGLSG